MFVIVVGAGKIGANLARTLRRKDGSEVVLIEQSRVRFDQLEPEFQHGVLLGDGTELHILERAGIRRPPDIVVAVTGDDEDNMVVCQLARERYAVPNVIARVNDPRNQQHFDLLGISPTVSATESIMALIEHEVPEHELVQLLRLRRENLEIVEVAIDGDSPAAGARVDALRLPEGTRLISVMRPGGAQIAIGSTVLQSGDQVLAVLEPGKEAALLETLRGA
jgi:trk system potassium uptake protein TrkA